MTDFTQSDADRLLSMDKFAANDDNYPFPDFGGKLSIELVNSVEKEEFVLNFTRGSINLQKRNHQVRGHKVIILARLDLDGPPHRNPDGQEIGPRHLHLYREGYADKWAFPIPDDIFTDMDNAYQTLQDFMRFCKVVRPPKIERSLFT